MARPHMGQRKLYNVKPPLSVATALEEDAAGSTLPVSQFIGDILAQRYHLPKASRRALTKRALEAQQEGLMDVTPIRRDRTPRSQYSVRLPADVAEALDQEALKVGIQPTTFITDALADHYGIQLSSERQQSRRSSRPQNQEALMYSTAS